ncbi:hypothetical protein PsYK624_131120 [Phanerochaete sordida]|uniref:Uncharacterized protein n=1 Tax=Phanerochaete sordida TaxID=48140 RepID=A0A9P3GP29_9APHY|nr:hypothetical protein PsYK624_131120 [Phanerochaete sordida]
MEHLQLSHLSIYAAFWTPRTISRPRLPRAYIEVRHGPPILRCDNASLSTFGAQAEAVPSPFARLDDAQDAFVTADVGG